MRGKKENLRRIKRKDEYFFDYSLLFVVLFLLGFGLVMVYSASSYNASTSKSFNYDAAYFLKKQAFASIFGIAAMIAFTFVPYKKLEKFAVPGYLGSLVLILLVLTPLGIEANGAKRWLDLGISVQPAEIAKLALILFLASMISRMGKGIATRKGFQSVLMITAPPFFMVWFLTDNLSSAIIIMGIAILMLFVASPEYMKFLAIGGIGLGIVVFVVLGLTTMDAEFVRNMLFKLLDFRANRVLAWIHPEDYATDTAFQTLQSLYAIGSGGLFGKGIGQSMQKMGYLPEVQNDMIFALICEELGIVGGICVILLFTLLIWRCVIIASNTTDLFGALLVVGVLGHIAIQVILNIAVVTNVIPNTGISLPFISYGGSSVLFLLIEIGVVLSVGRGIRLRDNM